MKKAIILAFGFIFLLSAISFMPSSVEANGSFHPISSGTEIGWLVNDYNETINSFDPADWWRTSDWSKMGEYNITIGDLIRFTVITPSTCTGSLDLGTLALSLVTREDIAFNLNIFVLASPPMWNFTFAPAFISSTNWNAQQQIANNASSERGATMVIQTTTLTFLNVSRTVISFDYNGGGTISNATYDYETGLLLHLYTQFGNYRLEMTLYSISPEIIPGFEAITVLFVVIGVVVLVKLFKNPRIITRNFVN